MDCLTDTSCLTNLVDSLNQLAAAIDFCGFVLFGDVWSPIGPDVEAGVEGLAQFFNVDSIDEQSNCTRYAKLVNDNA